MLARQGKIKELERSVANLSEYDMEQLLQEMCDELPDFTNVLLDDRMDYSTSVLCFGPNAGPSFTPERVVAMVKKWRKITGSNTNCIIM